MSALKRVTVATLLLYLCILPYDLSAQCCVAGNPTSSTDGRSTGGKNSLDISVGDMFSYSDTYYQGTKEVDNYKYIKNSYFNFSSLSLSYGLTDKLKISADLGYYTGKIQNFDFGGGQVYNRKAYGLGDGSIGISYQIFTNQSKSFNITPSLRATLPIGTFDQMYGPVVLPIDLQPSSGGYKYEGGLMFFNHFENTDFSLISVNTFEYSQRINTERTNYKYGNLYNFSILGIYNISESLTGILKFRAQIRDKAIDDANNIIEATGGFVLFLAPQIEIKFLDSWKFSLQGEIPIYRDLNGLQLGNKYAVSARISKRIDFGSSAKTKNVIDESVSDVNLKHSIFRVEGLCDHCKERIEKTVIGFDNVKRADWDKETKMLSISYSNQINLDAIKKALADAGHDNDSYKAKDDVYNALPECCKYRK
jgi:copper chaperone CopZ